MEDFQFGGAWLPDDVGAYEVDCSEWRKLLRSLSFSECKVGSVAALVQDRFGMSDAYTSYHFLPNSSSELFCLPQHSLLTPPFIGLHRSFTPFLASLDLPLVLHSIWPPF
jgi:hypothetical protein